MPNEHLAALKKHVRSFPLAPGIYLMHDEQGRLLYVGKAARLRARVAHYFSQNITVKTQALMAKVHRIEVVLAANAHEALLLEANTIKREKPRYNIVLKDDKSYPYLKLGREPFARLDFHRGAKTAKGDYYGPYPDAKSVREALHLIQSLFQLRQCSDSFFANRSRPCLQYQIKRCTAPCVGYVSKEAYAQQIKQAKAFLEGRSESVLQSMTASMQAASQRQDYEQAALLRDHVALLRKVQKQRSVLGESTQADVISMAVAEGVAVVCVCFIRHGVWVGHKHFRFQVKLDQKDALLLDFIMQYYLRPEHARVRLDRLVLTEALSEKTLLIDALALELGYRLPVFDRMLPTYRTWQQLAKKNAQHALDAHLGGRRNSQAQWEALCTALKLPNTVQHMVCFDISHTQGLHTYASCVACGPEGLKSSAYRRYKIQGITGGDDYAAMAQAIEKHYGAAARAKAGEALLPDVMLIDGGKGQLRRAAETLEQLQVSGVYLVGVAKGRARKAGDETLWLWPEMRAVRLPMDDPGFHLIQHVRDEAHRFAITGHRKKRAKVQQASTLEGVEGVGPVLRKRLIQHFGGMQALRAAKASELAEVKGVSLALAEQILSVLRPG